jgi:hypothetical protein
MNGSTSSRSNASSTRCPCEPRPPAFRRRPDKARASAIAAEPGESVYECVAFAAALCKYMGEPTGVPTGTAEDVDQLADRWSGSVNEWRNTSVSALCRENHPPPISLLITKMYGWGLPPPCSFTALDQCYSQLTGSTAASNVSGISLDQLHTMLDGIGLQWRDLPIDATSSQAGAMANF